MGNRSAKTWREEKKEGRKEEKRRRRRKTQTKGLQSKEEEELATLKALLLKGKVQKRERMYRGRVNYWVKSSGNARLKLP